MRAISIFQWAVNLSNYPTRNQPNRVPDARRQRRRPIHASIAAAFTSPGGYIPSRDVMPNFLTAFNADDGRTPLPAPGRTVTAPQASFMMNNELVQRNI